MPEIVYVQSDGAERRIDAAEGNSVMFAAMQNGVPGILAECGGVLSCATCHVYVDPAWIDRLPPPDADEEDMLANTAAERRLGSRLSCQITVEPDLAGLRIEVPATQS